MLLFSTSYIYYVKKFFFISFFLLGVTTAKAQQLFPIYQDTNRIRLNEVVIIDENKFGNDTLRYRYNQMRHYVKMILPYADKAVKMFHEIELETANMSPRQKRRFVKGRQHEIKVNFEDRLRSLNRTQGSYLVKAINRNLGTSVFSILKRYNKPLKAYYYRSLGGIYGIDLDEEYDPKKNKNFERIMKRFGY